MSLTNCLLCILVAAIWGINFLFIKLGVAEIPPLLLCALRFSLASLPVIFFIPPPKIPFKILLLYGFVVFDLQFAFMFVGIHVGMTPGMASLIMQTQVFFSMILAAFLLHEFPNVWQILGSLVAFLGIALVAMNLDATISFWGFICILLSALTWGCGNLIVKKYSHANMFSLLIWGCFVAILPMLCLSLLFEGPHLMYRGLQSVTLLGIISLLYIVCISTWIGYGIWNKLISACPISSIVPFMLLVPIFGIVASIFVLNEPFYLWKFIAACLVISGLAINLFGPKLFIQPKSLYDS